MANMSYCRFENTLGDLRDCEEALSIGALDDSETSESEKKAARRLVKLCETIARNYGDLES